ncbi:hypothetical protein BDN70DRAFT_875551 [Pholiota conissans]|uniref:GDP/GTP exchange factor Sec2 N-terminal domain-containing protein n=1 Tax=Pholiota conissans TaxID=109636 RepID=A0A9P5Z8S9_9AGAR|nr:hypothetical protein BDN70DRAFT_875551 [Pholiota conissans]
MLHFPSKLSSNPNGIPRRSDSLNLNATQQRSASNPLFLKIEEELHDARRVHADGQEDDLRYALSMVINRVTELSSMLSEAYKTQADLEVQLNVAKSNLQLVIANNEMLEDALKRDTSGQAKDVGWRRTSGRDTGAEPRASLERSQSVDFPADSSPPPSAAQDNRFFKFRFSSATPTATASRPPSRPESANGSPQAHHLTSPSLPSLRYKELDDLTAELEKERAARKAIADQKKALEEELESLSQALFEEANKMVATERKMRAETEEELKEVKMEKEALRSALLLVEGENTSLRIYSPPPERPFHSRSSSQTGIKSRPSSAEFDLYPPLPPSPSPVPSESKTSSRPHSLSLLPSAVDLDEEAQPTPRSKGPPPLPADMSADMAAMTINRSVSAPSQGSRMALDFDEPSPWADVPSRSRPASPERGAVGRSFATVAYAGMR